MNKIKLLWNTLFWEITIASSLRQNNSRECRPAFPEEPYPSLCPGPSCVSETPSPKDQSLLLSQKAKHLRHSDKRRVSQKAKHLRHFPTREHWRNSYKAPGADKRGVQKNFTTAFIPRASALTFSQAASQKAWGLLLRIKSSLIS
ncbi:MAG: hypothetical protein ACE14U_04480 [Candidatus Velamenicoccus archaeovorus]